MGAWEDIFLDYSSCICSAFDIFRDRDVDCRPKLGGTECEVPQATGDVSQESRGCAGRQCWIACAVNTCGEYLAYDIYWETAERRERTPEGSNSFDNPRFLVLTIGYFLIDNSDLPIVNSEKTLERRPFFVCLSAIGREQVFWKAVRLCHGGNRCSEFCMY